MTDSRAHISIYAELLQNIRQVSVAATLPSAGSHASSDLKSAAAETTATLEDGGFDIRIVHRGAVAQLALPAQVLAPPNRALPPGVPSAHGLAWRLPLAPGAVAGMGYVSPSPLRQLEEAAVPWPATALQPGGPVHCRGCGGEVVAPGTVGGWKDLPSENWAEMMEFWHCHKPGDHGHDHGHGHGDDQHHRNQREGADAVAGNGVRGAPKADEQSLASRGYGANSVISAQKSVGFVDLTSFLFAEEDCTSVMYSLPARTPTVDRVALIEDGADGVLQTAHISCARCETQLGYYNPRTAAVTLFKWQVSCPVAGHYPPPPLPQPLWTTPPLPPTVSECLSAALIATTARTGSSKSFILPILDTATSSNGSTVTLSAPHSSEKVLSLWILNNNIRFSSTENPADGPVPAIKLLYRTIPRSEADRQLENIISDVQEVNLPVSAIELVSEALNTSNTLLPPSERVFQGWQVGLLRRWGG